MRLGAYTACLHDTPLPETLRILAGLGLDSAEINSGGFLPAVHLPVEDLRSSETARTEYLGLFDEAGVALTALNCNGNPLDPDPEGARQAQDIYTSIEIAALLGVKRVVHHVRRSRFGTVVDASGVERRALAQRVPEGAGLPVERGGHPVLEEGAGGRR